MRRLLPDLDGELTHAADVVEEVLLYLKDCEEIEAILAPFGHDKVLEALYRLGEGLRESERTAGRGRLFAPDGRRELLPLHPVNVDPISVDLLSTAAQALGAPRCSELLDDALDSAAAMWTATCESRSTADVVQLVARLAGLLDLEWTEDAELLAPQLQRLDQGQDVVLTDGPAAGLRPDRGPAQRHVVRICRPTLALLGLSRTRLPAGWLQVRGGHPGLNEDDLESSSTRYTTRATQPSLRHIHSVSRPGQRPEVCGRPVTQQCAQAPPARGRAGGRPRTAPIVRRGSGPRVPVSSRQPPLQHDIRSNKGSYRPGEVLKGSSSGWGVRC